jgi:hypothetical protein
MSNSYASDIESDIDDSESEYSYPDSDDDYVSNFCPRTPTLPPPKPKPIQSISYDSESEYSSPDSGDDYVSNFCRTRIIQSISYDTSSDSDSEEVDESSASFGKLKKTQFYCLKCKKIVNNNKNKTKIVKLKNGKHSLTSKCNECDKKLFKFVKEKDVKNYESKYGKSKIYKSKGKKRSKK